MRYLKLYKIFESMHDYKKDPVIGDLMDLSMEILDDGATLCIYLFNKFDMIFNTIYFDHSSGVEQDDSISFIKSVVIPDRYTFSYVIKQADNRIVINKDPKYFDRLNEIESIIQEMHPGVNIRLVKY